MYFVRLTTLGADSRKWGSSFTLEHVYDASNKKSTGITEQGVALSEGSYLDWHHF